MSAAPPPARLVFLSELPTLTQGTKVRFLGCVQSYTPKTGSLLLHHPHPSSSNVQASVQIDHVLESVPSSCLEVGCWVNVTGYINCTTSGETGKIAIAQALMLWSAGDVKIGEYVRALEERQAAEREINKARKDLKIEVEAARTRQYASVSYAAQSQN